MIFNCINHCFPPQRNTIKLLVVDKFQSKYAHEKHPRQFTRQAAHTRTPVMVLLDKHERFRILTICKHKQSIVLAFNTSRHKILMSGRDEESRDSFAVHRATHSHRTLEKVPHIIKFWEFLTFSCGFPRKMS